MTLGEKSAALTGPDRSKYTEGIYSFSEVVDSTCERLMEKQIKYSIRRILEMDERLGLIERELDEFLFKKNRKPG
jgi:hypothetical protein